MAKQDYRSFLFEFAFFPQYENNIRFLADTLADKEDWDFSDTTVIKYSILKNYLEHTFRKLLQEKKISYTKDNKFSCFNTGLVTDNWEEIYAFFEELKNKTECHKTQFFFKAFVKKSDRVILKYFSDNLPEQANYFEKPELLIFNPKCELIPDIDHIISDNNDRFPKHLQNTDEAEIRRQLAGAIDDVKKKVKTNYTIAIPQYYEGKIQLLLPLCLTSGSPNADLALVTYRESSTIYSARTCLTLKMAYNNARLIVKPYSKWLKP